MILIFKRQNISLEMISQSNELKYYYDMAHSQMIFRITTLSQLSSFMADNIQTLVFGPITTSGVRSRMQSFGGTHGLQLTSSLDIQFYGIFTLLT